MKGLLVDSNVILDVFLDDPEWADWSESVLAQYSVDTILYINSIVYTEVSVGFKKIEDLESALMKGGFQMLDIPKEALFLAGKAFLNYRKSRGSKTSPLPDFYIGAHAAVLDLDLLTRDVGRYKTYFPTVSTICPQ
ncbi:MAG: type II toxin-antitoxin system VapC family toxin [Planctomycetes bacterium]|nr:type II toxin-antitoxin system VapC family toxin [Planctomycetota bacterium]